MRKSIYVSKGETSAFLMNYKGEEKQLSESLYRNLHVLIRFHEPTEDFLKIFEPHMFIKSNPLAFRYVVHYIFNCLDAEEFKKRFRWPILDYNGDVNFRVSTLDYMNHLNMAHKLGLGTLKKSNICIPGGSKFIKIIHKFTWLVMKKEIEKHEPLPNLNEIPDANEQLVKLEEFVEDGMNFVTRLETRSDALQSAIDKMNAHMKSFFGITETEQCWACLANEWRDKLVVAVDNKVTPYLEQVKAVNSLSSELNSHLEKLFVDRRENVIQFDKEKLVIAQSLLKKLYPNSEQVIDGIVNKNVIDFENLLEVFKLLLPSIMEKIEIFKFRNEDALQFEYNELEIMDAKALKLQNGMSELETSLVPFLKKEEDKFKQFCMGNPMGPSTLMCTPIMNRNPTKINRLALMNNGKSQTTLFKKPLPLKISDAANKSKISNARSILLQSSHNRLTSLDSSLAIISKRSRSQQSPFGISSTPKCAMNRPVDRTRALSSNVFDITTATTPHNVVDRFRQSNLQGIMRSPTRRFLEPNNVLE